jgi:hypothetical protein
MSIAAILVGMLATAVVQLALVMAGQHRGLAKRYVAIQESANIMERVSATPWTELTTENVADIELSPEAQQSLSGATLEIQVSAAEGEPAAKRVTVVIRWPDREARPDHVVRLVAWRYQVGGEG